MILLNDFWSEKNYNIRYSMQDTILCFVRYNIKYSPSDSAWVKSIEFHSHSDMNIVILSSTIRTSLLYFNS